MLILQRKVGQSIVIGDGIVVRLERIYGNRIALSVEAPKSVVVLRGELERKGNGKAAA